MPLAAAKGADLGVADTYLWIVDQSVQLSATDIKLRDWAIECGNTRAPYAWQPDQRRTLRASLDAAFFHLYGIERDDVGYIMDTFPLVKRKDEAQFGEYRTKLLILEAYDSMTSR